MKKIACIALAGILSIGTVLSAGCKKDSCAHNVGTWEIISPATCTRAGEQKGICGVCLQEVKVEIPVDKNAHVYGDWQVEKPTETAMGTATKVCSENVAHTLSASLPALSENTYAEANDGDGCVSTITKRPTVLENGERTYTIEHEAGTISFTTPIPNTGIQTVRDAVDLASVDEARKQIYSSQGNMGWYFLQSNDEPIITGSTSKYETNVGSVDDPLYITGTTTANSSFGTRSTKQVHIGWFSDTFTVGGAGEAGGFTLNGEVMAYDFLQGGKLDKVPAAAVVFQVYNDSPVAHAYELYKDLDVRLSGEVYEGELAPYEWTEIKITRAMFDSAVRDSRAEIKDTSGVYSKTDVGADFTVYNSQYVAGGTNEDKLFYIDGFAERYIDASSEHSYKFGDNYTEISDGADQYNRYYFILNENGTETMYGLRKDFDGKSSGEESETGKTKYFNELASSAGNESYIYGSRFYLQYANSLGYFYGTENLLEGLYRSARWSNNGDFEEWIEEKDGERIFGFSFGHVENSGANSGYFSKISVRFTLTEAYTVGSIWVESNIYVNNSEQGEEGDVKTWTLNENGHARVRNEQKNGTRYVSVIEMHQTLKTPESEPVVNPHTLDKMYIKDFAITYAGQAIPEGQSIPFASNVSTGYIFGIDGVDPIDAIQEYDFDGFSFYLRTPSGDIPIDYQSHDLGMSVHCQTTSKYKYNPETGKNELKTETTFSLKSKLSGNQQVVIKTKTGKEEVLNCNVSSQAPTKILPVVQSYDYTKGEYQAQSTTAVNTSASVYANQPLYFAAAVPEDEKYTAASTYFVVIRDAMGNKLYDNRLLRGSNGEPVLDAYDNEQIIKEMDSAVGSVTMTIINGMPVTAFIAANPGVYNVTLISAFDAAIIVTDPDNEPVPAKSCNIQLSVTEAPTFEELAQKTYTAGLKRFDPVMTVEVTFSDVTPVNELVGNDIVTVGYTATAAITTSEGRTEYLTCTYTLSDRTLTSVYADGHPYGFKLGFNEAYAFVLSRQDDDIGVTEEVVLLEKTA